MKTIIYIDEEQRARSLYKRRLSRVLGDEIAIEAIEPALKLEEMIELIETHPSLCSIIVDQKLTAAGTAEYVGTELVEKIRMVDKNIPLYILTNYSEEISKYLSDVEYVFSKDDLQDDDKLEAIGIRIKRHVNVFQTIEGEREQRFEYLLRKSVTDKLSEQELTEFSELRYNRDKKAVASTLFESSALQEKMNEAENKLQQIEALLKKG